MERSEVAAVAAPYLHDQNPLLKELDASLRTKAEKLVDAALDPALDRAYHEVARAMNEIEGLDKINPTVRSEIALRAGGHIRAKAIELTYNALLGQAIGRLTTTEPA